ncbi:hypothetical protein [Aureimonas populi]|uniref:Uncharacterized protein n=1 Tax=Aureimonas populi TaxID=1701758 RepID=A0ABW5CLZ4_9HYPH|nr:hypothetical protein [Aureimonas populi]
MAPHNIAFRSKREREKETKLLAHYKAIGIASIAAACAAVRRRTEVSRPLMQPQALTFRHAD